MTLSEVCFTDKSSADESEPENPEIDGDDSSSGATLEDPGEPFEEPTPSAKVERSRPKTPRTKLEETSQRLQSPTVKQRKTPDQKEEPATESEKPREKPTTEPGEIDDGKKKPSESGASAAAARKGTAKPSEKQLGTAPSFIPLLLGSSEGN